MASLALKQMVEEIKRKVTIPMYFYNVILPQMGDYYDTYPVNFDSKPVACCPLHDEDTPSFRYYENTNSFYCFGCQRGGDVIKLHQYFVERNITGEQPTYAEAVGFIYRTFVEGKETQEIVQVNLEEEHLNSDSDLVRYNVYRMNLEGSLNSDNSIKLDAKIIIWDALDKCDMLLAKNSIKATDATSYIKDTVRKALTVKNTC